MSHLRPAVRSCLFFTLLLGVVYPVAMTGIAQLIFLRQANGSLILQNGKNVGSRLIAQKFESTKYFWGRPSATDYNSLTSGGSNRGPISDALRRAADERRLKLRLAHGSEPEIPQHLLFASASGIDPDISPLAADYQIARVAHARGMSQEEVKRILRAGTKTRQFGILGEPTVNVLELNLALDQATKGGAAR